MSGALLLQSALAGAAHAAERAKLEDLAPAQLVAPGLFLLVLALASGIAFLPKGRDRAKRSLALLLMLVACLGLFAELLPLSLGPGLSLALFLGIFAVIYALGRFDSPL